MKITIEEIPTEQEEELIFRCHSADPATLRLIRSFGASRGTVAGYKGEEIHRLSLDEIYYFEVVDGKSFIYCKNDVYESRLRLYEFEELCRGTAFFRAAKSMVLNSDRIKSISPSFSGRFDVHLLNGETVGVSRQYVNVLRELLGV